MAFISKITLTQFRNYNYGTFDFGSRVVGIAGNNGVGKTNLLDAIYYACFTKSYFQSKEQNNVQQGFGGFRVEAVFENKIEKTDDTVSIVWRDGKKKITDKDLLVERVTDYIGKHTALMIAPDDIALINGASDVRRKFIDGLLSQSDAQYLEHLLHYQKIVAQRNAYLKQVPNYQINQDLMSVYDAQMAQSGAYIIEKREVLSQHLPQLVQEFYSQLSDNKEQVNIVYKSTCAPEHLRSILEQQRSRDIEARRTTTGVHTEDWLLTINDNPAKTHGSQGQKKSLLIGMKLAQLAWLRQLGKTPILLLDDIFEKLDKARLGRFFDILRHHDIPQLFMTHTDADDLAQIVGQYFESLQIVEL